MNLLCCDRVTESSVVDFKQNIHINIHVFEI